jgi:hypothetical protein
LFYDIIANKKEVFMFIKSGIISKQKIIELPNEKIIPFLEELILTIPGVKNNYILFEKNQVINSTTSVIKFFVKFLGYIIVFNKTIYYQDSEENEKLDRIEYLKNGFKLAKMSQIIFENGRIKPYLDPVQKEIEKSGFENSSSEENDLAFWYPKTCNLGFKSPKTLIISFTDEEMRLIKSREWKKLNQEGIVERIKKANQENLLDLYDQMFIRLGGFSNKFDFDSCCIPNIDCLFKKLLTILSDTYCQFEWTIHMNLVLREFIKVNYKRDTIYNNLPLNTEFRVFYDFNKKEIMSIYNYWDTNTMLDNLIDEKEIATFCKMAPIIERDFITLKPILSTEAEEKLPKADLKGIWSIDFMWDGERFVLIDMAHAECSYYYDKVLRKSK